MTTHYEIVRVYDNGTSEVWDDARTLKDAEKICAELDDRYLGWADAPNKHRIYEVKRRLVSFAERRRLAKEAK